LTSAAADSSARWSEALRKRKGATKITLAMRVEIIKWIINHDNVIHSPIANDALLVKGDDGVKPRVGKLLLEIPVRELHNEMVAPVAEGGLACARTPSGVIRTSDTKLRQLLKSDMPQLRRATEKHKVMCGCELCLTSSSHQQSLNAWRKRRLRYLDTAVRACADGVEKQTLLALLEDYRSYAGNENHTKPRRALLFIMCQPVKDGYTTWNCVLRRCMFCPKFPVNPIESASNDDAPLIRFHQYLPVTRCSMHGLLLLNSKSCPQCQTLPVNSKLGKVRTRKKLSLVELPIGLFIVDYYLPGLEKLAYHIPQLKILGTTMLVESYG
jgi:hypothetical protein